MLDRSSPDRDKLETMLLERVHEAETAYRLARDQHREILAELQAAGRETADLKLRDASAARLSASEKYREVLQVFTGLVLYDRFPKP